MELLKSHRSIRKFKPDEISAEKLNEILECGFRASNTGNMQLYSVVVSKDAVAREKLAPLHFNQAMVREAPTVLTICFDFNRFYRWCSINGTATDFNSILWLLNGFIDASLVAQNISVAAENSGLGICYLGTALYNCSEISRLLKLPKGVIPVTAIAMGYPLEIPAKVDRLPFEASVHFEHYCDYSDEEIREYYSFKESLEESKKFVTQNGKQNLAQVYAEVRYKTSDSLLFSKKIIRFLKEQGFDFSG